MASNYLSFDPESVASTSDVASSAYDLAGTASDAASSALVKAAAASTAAVTAAGKASDASSAVAARSAIWDKASAASSAVIVAAGKASDASSAVAARSATWDKASAASSAVLLKAASTIVSTPAASSICGFRASFQASEALTFPKLCYINANGYAALANADSAATASGMLVMAPGSVANAASFAAIMPGTMVGNTGWNWTLGAPIFMGSSAGSMTQTKPSAASAIVRVVGYGGRNSNVMWFDPDNTWIEV